MAAVTNKLEPDSFISYDNSRYNQNHKRISTKLFHMKLTRIKVRGANLNYNFKVEVTNLLVQLITENERLQI